MHGPQTGDEQMMLSFGTTIPSFARFPHLIVPNDMENLLICAAAANSLASPLDHEPFFDDDIDRSSISALEQAELCKLWSLPEHQAKLFMVYSCEMARFVPADIAPHDRVYLQSAITPDYTEVLWVSDTDLDDCMERARWFYRPIEYEDVMAIFIVRPSDRAFIAAAAAQLARRGVFSMSLTPRDGRYYWEGPFQFDPRFYGPRAPTLPPCPPQSNSSTRPTP
ncbi:MAG TPA: hypothetical protein VK157_09015 [Phycisphaerales bacterium]|nr:hypothetical protein [Phycisphaerales bacterium]